MVDIVCLHGLTQGPWCWGKTIPALSAMGYIVHAPVLEAFGGRLDADDLTLRDQSMQSAVASVCACIAGISDDVIIVGHDVGAAVGLQATRFLQGKRIALIGVAGLLPRFGESIYSLAQGLALNPAFDPIWECNQDAVAVKSEAVTRKLFHDSGLDDVILARRFMGQASRKALRKSLDVSDRDARRLNMGYICCTRDRVLPISAQRLMIERHQIQHVSSVDCGHAPYFRCADLLAQNIHEVALGLMHDEQYLRQTG